jgi:drug/metabolite transporter (DMT)-like permease
MRRAVAAAHLPLAVLAVALAGVSFGSIFVRLAAAPALAIALWRMTLASAVVVPAAALGGTCRGAPQGRAALLAAGAGSLLALHFAAWISSLEHTTVAISVLLVNTVPVWVALLGWATLGLRPTRRTWAAVGLAVSGGAVIAAGGLGDPGALLGYVLAVAGAVAMAGYLLLAREAQRDLTYLRYVAIAFTTAAAVLWIAVLASGTTWHGFSAPTWVALAAMALVSQLIGHGGYNWSLRHLQPAFVSVTLTGEPVLAAGLAWWLLGEPVTGRILIGGALVLAAILVAARTARS